MRTAFIEALYAAAQADPKIVLVVGDVGFGVVTPFQEKLPRQFVNAGVAEQNMTGLAAGMALSGKTVFTYSIANFPVVRCLEQIRNDVCYHKANVKVVAVGGGYCYGSLGATHHATEDLAFLRALPNMTVVAPGDPVEAALATKALAAHPGPAYLRLGRAGEARVHSSAPEFRLGKAIPLRDGRDLTLISSGGGLSDVVAAADLLQKTGWSVRVLSMPTVKPLDEEALQRAARETEAVFTVEEHTVVGGFGGAVAEVLLECEDRPAHFQRLGLKDAFCPIIGDQTYLREFQGLSSRGIAAAVLSSKPFAGKVRAREAVAAIVRESGSRG